MRQVGLLSPRTAATGNQTTIDRIERSLQACGFRCTSADACAKTGTGSAGSAVDTASEAAHAAALKAWAAERGVAVVIAIHAYRSGKLLRSALPDLPCVLVFGGTDVNEACKVPEKLGVMDVAVQQASVLVAFSRSIYDAAAEIWPACKGKMRIIPQSTPAPEVDTGFDAHAYLAGLGVVQPGEPAHTWRLCVLPAGLRPVKDVLYLAAACSAWHQRRPAVKLVIMGNSLDAQYVQLHSPALCQTHRASAPGACVRRAPPTVESVGSSAGGAGPWNRPPHHLGGAACPSTQ